MQIIVPTSQAGSNIMNLILVNNTLPKVNHSVLMKRKSAFTKFSNWEYYLLSGHKTIKLVIYFYKWQA